MPSGYIVPIMSESTTPDVIVCAGCGKPIAHEAAEHQCDWAARSFRVPLGAATRTANRPIKGRVVQTDKDERGSGLNRNQIEPTSETPDSREDQEILITRQGSSGRRNRNQPRWSLGRRV